MKTPDHDPIARLRDADPMNRRLPDEPASSVAARVFDRALAPEAVAASAPGGRRIRASRALPVLAVAAAIIAVVGLSLPRNAPGPVRATLGAEPASADRTKLIQAAEHQEANAAEEDPERVAKQQQFLDRLEPFPHDPTSAEVLAWLHANCDEVNAPTEEEASNPVDFDCVLVAAPTVINEAPAPVAADVLRALATLDVGLPTHAQRCPDWESVDPAWRGKVEEAESHFIWIKRNGTLLVMSAVLDEDQSLPGGDGDPPTKAEKEIREQIEAELGTRRVSTSLSPASAESEVFVQCQPPSPSAGPNAVTTVERAMLAYAETHGDGCSLGEVERLGLVAIDFAQACQTGVPQEEFEPPSCPADENGAAAFTFDDPDGEVTVTCGVAPEITTTSVGG